MSAIKDTEENANMKRKSYADTTGLYSENPEVLRLREVNAELLAALELIADQCEDHPVYIPDATDEDMNRECGDSAYITYLAQTARTAIARARGKA